MGIFNRASGGNMGSIPIGGNVEMRNGVEMGKWG
jgi:hypothetical protein